MVFEKGAVIGKCGRSANLECFTVKIYRIAYFYAVVFGVKSVDDDVIIVAWKPAVHEAYPVHIVS